MTHEIKCQTEFFGKVWSGEKTFEVRLNDRNYQVGDELCLREIRKDLYTGRMVTATITDVYTGEYCREGYCLISFHVTFPGYEMISSAVYLELWRKYVDAKKECDQLQAELDKVKVS